MSYLDPPRLNFIGKFFTDPSTVNNDPTHYIPSETRPSPWQMPEGNHYFEFRSCSVTSAIMPDGPLSNDPIIGTKVQTVVSEVPPPVPKPATTLAADASVQPMAGLINPNSPAKIVDLDVYQQAVTQIFGLRITLNVGETYITGFVDPPTLNCVWFNAVLPKRGWDGADYVQDSFGGDMNAAGMFMSAIRFPKGNWPQTSSTFLNALRSATLQTDTDYVVSMRFVLDGYRNVPEDNMFQFGRIVGSIGPVHPNESLNNPAQRWLMPRPFDPDTQPWYYPTFNNAPFKVDASRKKLIIDLANSICRQSAGGAPVDIGVLKATAHSSEPLALEIGEADYSQFSYENNADIVELPLTDGQLQVLQNGQLILSMSQSDLGDPGVLAEPAVPAQFCVENRVFRLPGDAGSSASFKVYISSKGNPLPGKQLSVKVESVHGNTPGATVPPSNPGNTPQADGALTATIGPSDQFGYATATITVMKNPGQRTPELDGQLYFVVFYDPNQPEPNWAKDTPAQDSMASVVVFSQYTVNQNPSWEDIQAMFVPYMKLFPGMKKRINMTDQATFTLFSNNPPWQAYGETKPGPLGIFRGAIPYYLSRDFGDARLMPVTRDLSPAKLLTVLYYIKNLQASPPPPQQ